MNTQYIDDEQWDNIDKIIIRVRKANDPLAPDAWCGFDEYPHKVICYICNEVFDCPSIDSSIRVQDVRKHGYKHLVDKKLLAFI